MTRIRLLGFAGSLSILIGSLGSGALPVYDPVSRLPIVARLRHGNGPHWALTCVYAGLVALALAWLYLGRAVRTGAPGTKTRDLLWTGALWALPLLVALPLFSRDLYSYAAQAQLTHEGIDPYSNGPAALPGPFLDEVQQLWVDTPAPYGPLWLVLGSFIAGLTGRHVVLTVWCMRLLAVCGVLLIARYLPRLADRLNVDPRMAVWIALLNPLLLIHFIGGGHNDALMLGLVVAGVTFAMESTGQRGLILGVVVTTLAVLVKAPAIIVVGFLAVVWARHERSRRPWLTATAKVCGVSLVTFVVATWASGLGIGWVKQLNAASIVTNWASIPTGIGMAITNVIGWVGGDPPRDTIISVCRLIGQAITVVATVVLWIKSFQRPGLKGLALSLFLLVVLGAVVQPWYLLWPLVIASVTKLSNTAVTLIAGGSVGIAMLVTPQGAGLFGELGPMLTTGMTAVLAAYLILGRNDTVAPRLAAHIPHPSHRTRQTTYRIPEGTD